MDQRISQNVPADLEARYLEVLETGCRSPEEQAIALDLAEKQLDHIYREINEQGFVSVQTSILAAALHYELSSFAMMQIINSREKLPEVIADTPLSGEAFGLDEVFRSSSSEQEIIDAVVSRIVSHADPHRKNTLSSWADVTDGGSYSIHFGFIVRSDIAEQRMRELELESIYKDLYSISEAWPMSKVVDTKCKAYTSQSLCKLHSSISELAKKGEILKFSRSTLFSNESVLFSEGRKIATESIFAYRLPFGSLACHKRELLKAQLKSGEQGDLAATSFEIHGAICPELLLWATGTNATDPGPIPDVELVYVVSLPSGKEFKFVTKPARIHVSHNRDDHHSLSVEDLSLIRSIDTFFISRSGLDPTLAITAAWEVFSKPVVVARSLKEAYSIRLDETLLLANRFRDDSASFESNQFDSLELFKAGVLRALNNISSMEHLVHAQKIAAFTFAERDLFVDYCVAKLASICLVTAKSAEVVEQLAQLAEQRLRSGYCGPTNGYALPLEHMVYDMLPGFINSQSAQLGRPRMVERVYSAHPDIYEIGTLPDRLRQIKRAGSVTATIFDPKNEFPNSIAGSSDLQLLGAKVLESNFHRIGGFLTADSNKQKDELRVFRGIFSHIASSIEDLRGHLQRIGLERKTALSKVVALSRQKNESAELRAKSYEECRLKFDQLTLEVQQRRLYSLAKLDKAIFNHYPEFARHNLAKITQIVDSEILKFIYVIREDASTYLSQETKCNDLRQRRTHSECAEGRNVFGAGELVLERHYQVFQNWFSWSKFHTELQTRSPSPWRARELNNATGHYILSPISLPYSKLVVFAALQSMDIETQNACVSDVLVRGVRLYGIGTY